MIGLTSRGFFRVWFSYEGENLSASRKGKRLRSSRSDGVAAVVGQWSRASYDWLMAMCPARSKLRVEPPWAVVPIAAAGKKDDERPVRTRKQTLACGTNNDPGHRLDQESLPFEQVFAPLEAKVTLLEPFRRPPC